MRIVCVVLVIATATSVLRAEDKPEPDVAAFKMGKVSLETKLEDFKKLYPTAKKDKESDAKLGTEVYLFDVEGMSLMRVQFLDGMPFQVQGLWLNKELGKIGGWETVFDKIKDKYGKQHEDSPGIKSEKPLEVELLWKNKAATKVLEFQLKGDDKREEVCVSVVNFELIDKLKERKRKLAKSGLDD